jgi:hypothetical protein
VKDDYIRFRCSKEEKATIRKEAKALGMSISAYLLWRAIYGGF